MKNILTAFCALATIITANSAHAATLVCESNSADIAAINPFIAYPISFWGLDMPKKFEIETDGKSIKSINYKFTDLVQEEGIASDSSYDKKRAFKKSYEDLQATRGELYRGYVETTVSESSKSAELKTRYKWQKWGMDVPVNKTWTLTLDKTDLTGTIEGVVKHSFFKRDTLTTRFKCK